MGKGIHCKLSDRKPDELMLKSIQDEVDRRIALQHRADDKDHFGQPTILQCIGVDCGFLTFVNKKLNFVAEWASRTNGAVKFGKDRLIIDHSALNVHIHISYRQIHELLWSERGDEGTLTFTLYSPPTFLVETAADLQEQLAALTLAKNKKPTRRRSHAINGDHGRISDFCLVYNVAVNRGRMSPDLLKAMTRLKKNDLVYTTRYKLPMIHRPASFARYDAAVAGFKNWLGQVGGTGEVPFSVLFQLQALVYNSYLHPSVVQAAAIRLHTLFKDAKREKAKPPVTVEAMRKVSAMFPYPSPFDVDSEYFEVNGYLKMLFEAQKQLDKAALTAGHYETPSNQTRVFRAVVTPGRITLHGPELEASNRVLRKYPKHQDHFLRVQFQDEDGQDLYYSAGVDLDEIYTRFKSVLSTGIAIAGRVYHFLGFSHSSLRSHSAWTSAAFWEDGELHLRDRIVGGLGDFTRIRSPARQAARIGQAFSETPFSIPLDEEGFTVIRIRDVERSGRVFSDGVGTISPEAVEAIWGHIPRNKGAPTAFQIRFAGAKGMLAIDPSLSGRKFCLRPSMEKFPSDDTGNLEICDMAAKPIGMVLNRSMVKILEDMGVAPSWFMFHQEKELQRLRGITANVTNTATFLEKKSIGEGFLLHRFIRQANLMGIDYRRDQFLRNVVEACILKELRLLKHKARIPIPEGMTLFGVMDESGFLQEGEVFINFDDSKDRQPAPSDADVLVTRSPALHPGDVQRARARTPPRGHGLWRLRNCIAFSKFGQRDLPSELSGGDLDGDLFNVIWDSEVVHQDIRTYPSADYPRVPPRELDRPVKADDIIHFFVDFMKTDHLSVIANRHLAFADHLKRGTLEPGCLQLAQLHSTAVDFSKTGIPVEMSELPKSRNPRMMKYKPDFMAPGPVTHIHNRSEIEMDEYNYPETAVDDEEDEGPRHRYYRSEKILGHLYRNVDEHKIWYHNIKTVPMGGASFWDQFIPQARKQCKDLGVTQWQHWSDEARNLRHIYEDNITEAASKFSESPSFPLQELEVFIGFAINRQRYQSSRQRDASMKLKEEFERFSTELARNIRRPVGTAKDDIYAGVEMAMACLEVGTYPHFQPQYAARQKKYESFKIIAGAVLLRELKRIEDEGDLEASGGGYVGVRGGNAQPTRTTVHTNTQRMFVPSQVEMAVAKTA